MKQPLYLLSDGVLYRHLNTLYFINKESGKKPVPVENISDIYCLGNATLKAGAAMMLMEKGVPVHFFNKHGFYTGTLYPRVQLNSGLVIVKQAENYLDPNKRSKIAAEIVRGIKHNVIQTLKYYAKKGKELDQYIMQIEKEEPAGDISTIMSSEGRIWAAYYDSFNIILNQFTMEKREIRPPTSEVNAMISFGNALLYSVTLSEIYNTYLHPSISYLHEPSERRFSLALDIADIFKPVVVERTIFNLVNNKVIDEGDFNKEVGVFLSNSGKRKFIASFDEKMNTTVKHPELGRNVTYRYIIRLEAYKIMKHVLGDKNYVSFKVWW